MSREKEPVHPFDPKHSVEANKRREPEPEEKREAVRPGTLEHKPTSYIEGRFRH